MEETMGQVQKTWKEFIPRKIAGGIAAMWLLGKAAVDLKEVSRFEFAITIGCMAALGTLAIWTHYLLERGPKPKVIKELNLSTQDIKVLDEKAKGPV